MENVVRKHLSSVEFGTLQHHGNIGVIPLLLPSNGGPKYLTLKDTRMRKMVMITEVNDSGTVPELKVINRADLPVLLLDGEELVGAKQNRMLNASILVKEKSETIIPVSCTEARRWSYSRRKRDFDEADTISPSKLRAKKAESVRRHLEGMKRYYSNQGEVWREIEKLHRKFKTKSKSRAMKHVFDAQREKIHDYMAAFEQVPGQKGLLVMINGRVAGFDIVSLESAYQVYHEKFVRGYILDAFSEEHSVTDKPSVSDAKEFMEHLVNTKESRYASVGLGWDYRYNSDSTTGTALVYQDTVVHAAFFEISADETRRSRHWI